eukprot:2486890-Amphidinium_carterae.1
MFCIICAALTVPYCRSIFPNFSVYGRFTKGLGRILRMFFAATVQTGEKQTLRQKRKKFSISGFPIVRRARTTIGSGSVTDRENLWGNYFL